MPGINISCEVQTPCLHCAHFDCLIGLRCQPHQICSGVFVEVDGTYLQSLLSNAASRQTGEPGRDQRIWERSDFSPRLFDAALLILAYKDFLTYMQGEVVPLWSTISAADVSFQRCAGFVGNLRPPATLPAFFPLPFHLGEPPQATSGVTWSLWGEADTISGKVNHINSARPPGARWGNTLVAHLQNPSCQSAQSDR